ncbi:aldo/keto reductase [Kribbella sp. NPDC051770]|uniref:aldo/keto reductase n=1 Tax=Kribbella sp. NPDC051770 TaxID=3155413 RepID=UPI0034198E59
MTAPSRVLAARTATRFRPPRFGLGGSRLGIAEATAATATVDAAYAAGIRFFDTSPAYGESERRLGAALAPHPRSGFLLSTKVAAGLSSDGVRASVAASLERLGVTTLDLVFVLDPGDRPVGAAYGVLADLREEGKVGAIGVAGREWQRLDRAVRDHELDAVLLAGQYSLLDRSGLPLLDRCQARGVAAIVSGVLTREILLTDRSRQNTDPLTIRARRMSAVCEPYGVSLPQAALAFPGRHPAVTSVLIGAAAPAEIRADAALVRQPVPEQFWRDPELMRLLGE